MTKYEAATFLVSLANAGGYFKLSDLNREKMITIAKMLNPKVNPHTSSRPSWAQ